MVCTTTKHVKELSNVHKLLFCLICIILRDGGLDYTRIVKFAQTTKMNMRLIFSPKLQQFYLPSMLVHRVLVIVIPLCTIPRKTEI